MILVDAGAVAQADKLYRDRLRDGQTFMELPAPNDGVDAALAFVNSKTVFRNSVSKLGRKRTIHYLVQVGLNLLFCGERSQADKWLTRADNELGKMKASPARLKVQYWRFVLRVAAGDLRGAEEIFTGMSKIVSGSRMFRDAIGLTSAVEINIFALRGDIEQCLIRAGEMLKARAIRERHLERWVMFFLQLASLLAQLDLPLYVERLLGFAIYIWNDARTRYITQTIMCMISDLNMEEIDKLENFFRSGHDLFTLPDVLNATAKLLFRKGAYNEVLIRAEEALEIAGPRGHRLQQIDALIMRGNARLGLFAT